LSLQEFCRKYPEYCNQELYERMSGKASGNHAKPGSSPPRVYARDIPNRVGSSVVLEGVVMDVEHREYPRRNGSGVVKVTAFTLYDKTGKAGIRFVGDGFIEISDGDIVRVEGRVGEWKGRLEIQARRVEKLGRIEVDKDVLDEVTTPPSNPDPPPRVDKKAEAVGKVLSLLKSAKSQGRNVYYDKLEGLLSKLGLGFSDIEGFVEVKEVSVPGSLEKVKVVELRDGVA